MGAHHDCNSTFQKRWQHARDCLELCHRAGPHHTPLQPPTRRLCRRRWRDNGHGPLFWWAAEAVEIVHTARREQHGAASSARSHGRHGLRARQPETAGSNSRRDVYFVVSGAHPEPRPGLASKDTAPAQRRQPARLGRGDHRPGPIRQLLVLRVRPVLHPPWLSRCGARGCRRGSRTSRTPA